jgi:hypothetical protein
LGKGFKFGRWAKRFLSFATLPVDEAYMRSYSYYDTAELKELFKDGYTPPLKPFVPSMSNYLKPNTKTIWSTKFAMSIRTCLCWD